MDKPTRIPHMIPFEAFSHIHWSDFIAFSMSFVHPENKVADEDKCAPTEPTPEVEANNEYFSP